MYPNQPDRQYGQLASQPVDTGSSPSLNAGPPTTVERRNEGTTRFLRDGSLNVGGAAVSRVAMFAIVFLLARTLGQDGVGVYSEAYALRALLLLICALGMRTAMTKFVAAALARSDTAMLHGSVRLGLGVTVAAALASSVLLYLGADGLATDFYGNPDVAGPIRVVSISLLPIVVMTVALAATQGFQSMRAFAGIGLIFEPSLRFGLTAVALAAGFGVMGSMSAVAASSFAAGALALWALRKHLAPFPTQRPRYERRELASFAGYSWVASMATQGLLWADIVVLGALVSSSDVGLYQVATRAVLMATFAIAPLTSALAPRVADRWETDDIPDMMEMYVSTSLWCWRLTAPLLAILAVAPDLVLRLFGESFAEGRTISLILVVGACGEALSVPAAVVLNQVGLNRLSMYINVFALVLNLAANLVLVPIIGLPGAALAWTLALVIPGILRVIALRRKVAAVGPWSRLHTRATLAVVVAGAMAWAGRSLFDLPAMLGLLVVLVTIGVTYGVVLWYGGLSPREKEWARRTLADVLKRSAALQRWRLRTQLKRLPTNDARLEIGALISPFRYDVLVRVEFFRLARANRSLIETDLDAFIDLASRTSYRVWFEEIAAQAAQIGPANPDRIDQAFARRVRTSIDLMNRYESYGGFDPRYPVTVNRLPAGTPLQGKTLPYDQWLPVNGCHRLALLYLDNQKYLRPEQYRIDPSGPLLSSTTVLVRELGVDEASYTSFVGLGFNIDGAETVEELIAAASERSDALAHTVAGLVDVDLTVTGGTSRAPDRP